MSLAVGPISKVSVADTSAQLSCAAASGGTGPYTYQWYRSTTSGFTPGAGNILAGATALSLSDSGLIPNTQYYYEVVVTDTGNANATADSAQFALATLPQSMSPNQFAQSQVLGVVDLRVSGGTISVQIDASQATPLYAGGAVKMVDSADGVPKVVGCSANSDEVLGFINFDVKSQQFVAGSSAEISIMGNVIYLYATGAISRGAQVQLDVSTMGGVAAKVGSSGADIVGWAVDKAAAAGALIRVFVITPSFLKA